jgi:predicted ester cyclase
VVLHRLLIRQKNLCDRKFFKTNYYLIMKRIALLTLLACFALTSCNKTDATTAATNPAADSMKAAYTAVMAAFESGNTADLDKYVAADSKDHQAMPGYPQGVEGLKKMIADYRISMPDGKYTVEDMRVDGDVLVARVRMSGTNTGPMMGMPATGKKVTDMMFIDWVRWQNGKFVEHWGVGEEMKMMEQLGLMPPMGAPPADSTKKAM